MFMVRVLVRVRVMVRVGVRVDVWVVPTLRAFMQVVTTPGPPGLLVGT
jgi:hypothetical protein